MGVESNTWHGRAWSGLPNQNWSQEISIEKTLPLKMAYSHISKQSLLCAMNLAIFVCD